MNVNAIEKSLIGIISVAIASQWAWVHIPSVKEIIFVGLLMQLCLSFFIGLEAWSANKWKQKGDAKKYKIGRGITSYISLVGGKFVTMGIIAVLFKSVAFTGWVGGVVAFFGIIFLIMGMEKAYALLVEKLINPMVELDSK
ncbi:hypothetical protein [Vibrio superstes]|uniref:Uncharacterized protein n=1 Tax=Vibrio superstes NBRC 103154 TaxID=1219062 RepID=A0A511QPS4_9VIBR|nr:hypothetical protein [Vibrio superstes]GEM79338.1 hypothetical protein VSU01S_15830 [Vibrio superstes NBRC 103154]